MVPLTSIEPRSVRDWLWPRLSDSDQRLVLDRGENYETYTGPKYDWYCGIGYILKPRTYLEIGVRYGYSVACVAYGAGMALEEVDLIDNEMDGVPLLDTVATLQIDFPAIKFRPLIVDSILDSFKLMPIYDLVHIDGCHSYDAAVSDLWRCGVRGKYVIVDDINDPNVWRACEGFAIETDRETRIISHNNGMCLIGPEKANVA